MTNEEIIADERYHTCGRCKWEDIPYICHQCKWGEDTRKDLWGLKEETQPEPFINKPCISKGVCHEDKMQVLDKIRAEIQKLRNCSCSCSDGIIDEVEDIIDKYKAESEK